MDVRSLAINDIVKVHHCFILGFDLFWSVFINGLASGISFIFIHHIIHDDKSGVVHLKLLGWGMNEIINLFFKSQLDLYKIL